MRIFYFWNNYFPELDANDEGRYYDGIQVDCPATDDLSRYFGDVNENSLHEALYYIENNSCSRRKRNRADFENKTFPLYGFKQEIGAF